MAWVWERSALVQCSAAMSWPRPHAHDHQILQYTSRVRADSETGKRVYKLLGCDKTKLVFSGLIYKSWHVSHLMKLNFMVYGVNIVLTITKMSLSSGKLGGYAHWGYFPMKHLCKELKICGYIQPTVPAPCFGIFGLESWISPGKGTPPKWACLKRSEIDSWAS